jgi:hypothetical protein
VQMNWPRTSRSSNTLFSSPLNPLIISSTSKASSTWRRILKSKTFFDDATK